MSFPNQVGRSSESFEDESKRELSVLREVSIHDDMASSITIMQPNGMHLCCEG